MKWKVNRFDLKDFKNADRIERIFIAIVQPNDFTLNNDDKVYLEILQKAYPIIQTREEPEALQMIANLEAGKWRNQYEQIYRDSKRLYDSLDISPEMIKGIAIRQLMLIAGDMQKNIHHFEDENAIARAGDVARKSWEAVMKYAGIANLDPNPKIGALPTPSMLSLPVHPMYEDAILETADEAQHNILKQEAKAVS
jgi:hypothetical protein